MQRNTDIAVIGAGSGGIGAALAAARQGSRVLLVERAPTIGGTAVRAGVSTWEPVAGATGIPFEIYLALRERPDAVACYSYGRHICMPRPGEAPFPGGEHVIDRSIGYLDTLQRHGMRSLREDEQFARETLHGVVFEPDAYAEITREMLHEAGAEVLTGVALVDAEASEGRVERIRLSDGSEVRAPAFIDCTGDGALCARVGCEMMAGRDSRERFGEPHAPEAPSRATNAATLIYRVMPADTDRIEPLPADIPAGCWWRERFPSVSAVQAPQGGYIMNMLPTAEYGNGGNGELARGNKGNDGTTTAQDFYEQCQRRVLAHWHYVQSEFPEFRGYRLTWIAPEVGLREERRVVGEYVLTEHDLLAGLAGQQHDDVIAIADHAMDLHGEGGGCRELTEPCGVPFRCLVAKGMRNVLVASRASSFSAIAASSCRLSRTMMQLGQAAGTAAAMAVKRGIDAHVVPPVELREDLREQHVQLEWPLRNEVREWMAEEEMHRPKRSPASP